MKTFFYKHRVKLIFGIIVLCFASIGSFHLIPTRFEMMVPRDQIMRIIITQMRMTPGGQTEFSDEILLTKEGDVQAIYDTLCGSRFRKKLLQPALAPYSIPFHIIGIRFEMETSSESDTLSVFKFDIFDDDRNFTHPRPDYDDAVQISKQWGESESKWYDVVGGAQRRKELYQSLEAAIEGF
jgi:hypothetical protein